MPTPSAKAGRTNDPAGLKRRLLDAAFAAFTGDGYAATAVHDLKRAAGVSGGALAHHFPTKKALGLAVVAERVAPAVEAAWIRPVLAAPTATEGVRAAFAAIVAELEGKGRVTGCPLNNLAVELAGQDAEMRAAVDAVFRRWRAAVADKLRDDQAGAARGEGEGAPAAAPGADRLDPEAAASFVVAAYSGAMAMAKAAQDPEPLRTCAAEVVRYLEGG